ncbi:MAG: NAD-dependent epimerase/dehydratase family protein [Chitinophagales bacterium]|nr:NAD-dependent epimerase/dehydratase family protein [Chitinophagales bacterium]
MKTKTILITGANGQIGTVLTEALRERFGTENVIATDIRKPDTSDGPFELLDVLDKDRFDEVIRKYEVGEVYHLAAILSAKGEQNPKWAWEINMTGLLDVLDLARKYEFKLFFPSSIAVFGGNTPRVDTPQDAVLQPETVYGISKSAGENWCQYYHNRYGVDVRSVRYPGIIGYQSLPGGGTTDYAVDIYHYAVKEEAYTCFLKENARLPMMYMEDAIRATIEIMQAPAEKVKLRGGYNIAGTSFTPEEVAATIKTHYPDFSIQYEPDFRQDIASSWPESISDEAAREDWGWKPKFGLKEMTEDMLHQLKNYYRLKVS